MVDPYVEMKAALPSSYVDYIEANTGWEGFPAGYDAYVVIWDKQLIRMHYDGYELAEYLDPRWFAFGSNGAGEMLCFDLNSGTDAVYMLPFIGMSDEEPLLLCESFSDLASRIEPSA
jgi:hypothetical protein